MAHSIPQAAFATDKSHTLAEPGNPASAMVARSNYLVGWDVGGAHLKAALLQLDTAHPAQPPRLLAVLQLPCPLWQGIDHLERALQDVLNAWPPSRSAHHAITMTGELVDAFPHREAGVQAITAAMQAALPQAAAMSIYAGPAGDSSAIGLARWVTPAEAGAAWAAIASANWLATAQAVAASLCDCRARRRDAVDAGFGASHEALLVDIGSTTTDLIALRGGQVLSSSRSDIDRLASGELVYQGVVRTPLCSLGAQVAWHGRAVNTNVNVNVMNEFFATTADIYRLLDELDPAHDQYPPADGADKSALATRRRLARMIGLDARDAADADWLALAAQWRSAQLALLAGNAERVIAHAGLAPQAPLVLAGAGHRLGAYLAARLGRPALRLDALWAPAAAPWPDELADGLVLAAPCVAVARLMAGRLAGRLAGQSAVQTAPLSSI